MTDLPGFLVALTLDGTEITAQCNDVALNRTRNAMAKATMDGTGFPTQLAGQETGELAMNGQVDTAGWKGLEQTWGKAAVVPFNLVVGDSGTIDAGTYSGSVLLSSYGAEASADGMWNFALTGTTSGLVLFTPPA